FSHPKNVEKAIDAAKQVESGQYYEQQSPIPTQPSGSNNAINNLTKQMEQLSLNYATLSNALSAQLEGKPERRKPKDDRNPTKDDELEQVLDDYKKEELSKIEAYMADSQEEYEEETDLLPLDYNPWNEENHVYLTLAFKEKFEANLVVFLAETFKENIWKIK
ncbi:7402_t:CDS:2, partial [Funneliformis caledonium]